MERLDLWWSLAGPSRFVAGVTKAIAERRRVVCLRVPDPVPADLERAIEKNLRDELSLDCVSLDLQAVDQSRPLPHVLGSLLGVPTVEVGSVGDFASHQKLADQVVIVGGLDRRELRRWALFLRHLSSEDAGEAVIGPILVVLVPTSLKHEEFAELRGSARTLVFQGFVDRYDTAGYASLIGARVAGDLPARVGQATVLEVAAWSRPLLEAMVVWEIADQINPMAQLERAAAERPLPFPHWENGLVDLWDDEPAAHPVAAIGHGLHDHVRRRIWTAQAGVVLPYTHRVLRSLIQRYRDVLDRAISPRNPFKKTINDRVITIIDPAKLEFYDLREHTRHLLSAPELDLIKTAAWCRNAVAHRDIIPPETIERLSELYVDNFDLLETDIPGWNWPRCGQTLTMTVGPSGAGKSTWSAKQGIEVISSDGVRVELHRSAEVPGDQSGVFRHVRMRSTQVLSKGNDVIVDAMHVDAEDRTRQSAVAPPDVRVRYVIIDRPLDEKRRDGGWRLEKGLVDKYDRLFAHQIRAAMTGDGRVNVEILDLRGRLATSSMPSSRVEDPT
jgi:predicted kinase